MGGSFHRNVHQYAATSFETIFDEGFFRDYTREKIEPDISPHANEIPDAREIRKVWDVLKSYQKLNPVAMYCEQLS